MNSDDKKNDIMFCKVEQEDRLSALPNSLLVSILSLLQTKAAASTSALSHRWRHLWTQITHFRYNRYNSNHKLYSIIDRFFQQNTSTRIHGFDICFPNCPIDALALETCFRRLIALNVEEIRLRNWNFSLFVLPTYVFQCQSLVVLELNRGFGSNFSDDCDIGSVNLPNLKELRLEVASHSGFQMMLVLLKSIPSLEVLDLTIDYYYRNTIDYYYGNNDVPSIDIPFIFQNLRWLSISSREEYNYVIDAPKLETMIYHGPLLTTSFHFIGNSCSLVKAQVYVSWINDNFLDHNNLRRSGLVEVICSVRSLKIRAPVMYALIPSVNGSNMPSFHKLVQLRIKYEGGCENLLHCLQLVPNLKIFVLHISTYFCRDRIKWVLPATVPLCLSSKLEEFQLLEGIYEDLSVLQYILRNADVLKRLLVHNTSDYKGHYSETFLKQSQFCEELFRSRRTSESCVIEFRGTYHNASNVNFNDREDKQKSS